MTRIALIALALLVCGRAEAYIPSGGFIIGRMADKRTGLNVSELEASMQTTWAGASDAVDDKLQIKRPARLRWSRVDGDRAYIVREGDVTEVDSHGAVSSHKVDIEPLVDLLVPKAQTADTGRAEYLALCQKIGIDASFVSLQRFASGVAYVLGGKSKDTPSLWIDKDTVQPVRIVYKGEYQGKKGLWDVQFREFRETSDVLPRVIERFFDGKLVSRSEVVSVSTNVKLPEGTFSAPHGKS